jgi:hypothetical protein
MPVHCVVNKNTLLDIMQTFLLFWNLHLAVVDQLDQLDRSCEKLSITQSQGEQDILHTIKRRKAN